MIHSSLGILVNESFIAGHRSKYTEKEGLKGLILVIDEIQKIKDWTCPTTR